MRFILLCCVCGLAIAADKTPDPKLEEAKELKACAQMVLQGLRKIPADRAQRFLGKVSDAEARCRGERDPEFRLTPWVDWSHYWGTGDVSSLPSGYLSKKGPAFRGVTGALLDLEYERVELIKFNLFDNTGTWRTYVTGAPGVDGPAIKIWPELRLPMVNPLYQAVGGNGQQVCRGDLIRARTLSGVCNDILNPLMGSTGTPFARNVEFETTYPDQGQTILTKNRHGDRLGLYTPDPQVISRKLFTRAQTNPAACNSGFGLPGDSADANCDYQKAPFFNVLAAYWIQFMTHDWFSHMDEGHNATEYMNVGCTTQLVNNVETPLTPDQVAQLSCRPADRVDKTLVLQDSPPEKFTSGGRDYLSRAPKTFSNNTTAWWDASQLYGYDETSRKRVKRDPADMAKMLLEPLAGAQQGPGYLPVFQPGDPIQPQWAGQEAAAFPDNWSIGLSFYHNLFAREHNSFVEEFRRQAAKDPNGDSGLRNPADAKREIRNKDVTPDELFEVARLVVAAEIAKIHTTEWTPQLLYDEPLYKGMNANWNGLLGSGDPEVSKALSNIVVQNFGKSKDAAKTNEWYSVLASGPGIFGIGSKIPHFDLTKPADVNGGVNHFGSPFNFPEEFVTVYRLHAMIPDLIEYRQIDKDPNQIAQKVAVINTFEGKATEAMRSRGLANWGLSMGRQRLGLLTLHNIPQFMQNIRLPRLDSPTQQLDITALDIIRDREHGVPRFNEFRRQYGLRQLTSFDDFTDKSLPADSPARKQQEADARQLREVYGTHVCDSSKVITDAQVNGDGTPINDCLGHPNGSVVDNIEDVDTVVGWMAESVRPHGYAISETQFVVFILNASRRLFSDRFFTSSFRPEFYTKLGIDWVSHNGPGKELMEKAESNGHQVPVSPLKRVLLRNIPELSSELQNVVNVFDPWARDRGQYYSVEWKPQARAASDPAFRQTPAK
ncbi:MAG TPA: peroxidase family protein [Bryobacteraceae bacterium]|nr:peroxidase family protein [Bryobacteraceae bacterium]